jgi:DNA repair exonuclease SbcCD ATPase subunit
MRSVTLLTAALLGCLALRAQATDYELTIDPGAKGFIKSGSLTLYEPYGLVKPGDRIISILAAPLPKPNMGCKVTMGADSGSQPLAPSGSVQGFHGEIRLGQGEAPLAAIRGALLMHTVTPANAGAKDESVVQKAKTVLVDRPWLWILFCAGGLVLIVGAVLRLHAPPPGTVPIYGKKAYEENIREIRSRLDRVIEAQELLVRKPPVLRTFRKQIDRFDSRLNKLETVAITTQQALSVLAGTVVELEGSFQQLSESGKKTADQMLHINAGFERLDARVQNGEKASAERHESLAQVHRNSTENVKHELLELSAKLDQTQLDLKGLAAQSIADQAESGKRSEVIQAQLLQIQASHSQFEQLPDAVQTVRATLADLGKTCGDLTVKVTELAAHGQEVGQDVQLRLESVQGHLQELKQSVEGVDQLAATVESLQERLKALSADQEGSFAALSSGIQQLDSEVAKEKDLASLQDLPAALSSVGQQLEQLSAEVGHASGAERLQTAVDGSVALQNVQDALKELGGRLEILGASSQDMKQAVEDAHLRTKKLEESLDGVSSLRTEVASLELGVEILKDLGVQASQKIGAVGEALGRLGAESATSAQVEELVKATELALANTPSLATIEARLSSLKGNDHASEESLRSLADLLNKLAIEVTKREELEDLLQATHQTLSELPLTLASFEERLGELHLPSSYSAEPTRANIEVPGVPELLDRQLQLEAAILRTQESVAALPQSLEPLFLAAQGLRTPASEDELTSVVSQLLERLGVERTDGDRLLQSKLEELALQVSFLANKVGQASLSPTLQHVSQPELDQIVSKPAKALKDVEMPQQPFTGSDLTEHSVSTPHSVIANTDADELAGVLSAVGETDDEMLTGLTHEDHRLRLEGSVDAQLEGEGDEQVEPNGSNANAEWGVVSASPLNTWSSEVGIPIKLANGQKASRALTPTETPGIEYQVGALLFSHRRVIYGHGDSVRGFWPGSNERFATLSAALPDDPWRMLVLGERLFCALEKKVDVIDIGTWGKYTSFQGEYLAHTCNHTFWAGLRNGKSKSLEFRDVSGEISGKPVELPHELGDDCMLVSDGSRVYVASDSGMLIHAAREGARNLGHGAVGDGGRLLYLAWHQEHLVSLASDSSGVSLRLLDKNGKVVKERKCKEMSGNPVIMGDRLYFFSPDRHELLVCDLKQMLLIDSKPLENVHRVRKLAGAYNGKSHALLVAGSDEAGQLGSVFLFDPKTGEQVSLCSTNQPRVDIIFAGERAVVATSSSYQNIIRVFEPFAAEKAQSEAA